MKFLKISQEFAIAARVTIVFWALKNLVRLIWNQIKMTDNQEDNYNLLDALGQRSQNLKFSPTRRELPFIIQ